MQHTAQCPTCLTEQTFPLKAFGEKVQCAGCHNFFKLELAAPNSIPSVKLEHPLEEEETAHSPALSGESTPSEAISPIPDQGKDTPIRPKLDLKALKDKKKNEEDYQALSLPPHLQPQPIPLDVPTKATSPENVAKKQAEKPAPTKLDHDSAVKASLLENNEEKATTPSSKLNLKELKDKKKSEEDYQDLPLPPQQPHRRPQGASLISVDTVATQKANNSSPPLVQEKSTPQSEADQSNPAVSLTKGKLVNFNKSFGEIDTNIETPKINYEPTPFEKSLVPHTGWKVALDILSWVAFLIAILILVTGSLRNGFLTDAGHDKRFIIAGFFSMIAGIGFILSSVKRTSGILLCVLTVITLFSLAFFLPIYVTPVKGALYDTKTYSIGPLKNDLRE